jgi:hypothetical protein
MEEEALDGGADFADWRDFDLIKDAIEISAFTINAMILRDT